MARRRANILDVWELNSFTTIEKYLETLLTGDGKKDAQIGVVVVVLYGFSQEGEDRP